MRKTIIIILFVLIAIVIFLLVGLKYFIPCNTYLDNFLYSILASLFVVLFIEIAIWGINKSNFLYFNREYKRIEIYNKLDIRTDDKIYENITPRYIEKNINPSIKIKYKGEGLFQGTADYEIGSVKFEIFLDQTNPNHGSGIYQYTKLKDSNIQSIDFGKYELNRDIVNKRRLIIYYTNIVPSGLAEGYEIWE